ncbi:hypothetical protein [Xanthomonas phage Suba]|uniref:Uncharacterized protein n=1 Tax=Xanthomonas phage Suba TaxID=2674975 RepID=A0A679K1U6_9CAUD|nr:hypothetical protein QAY88_gp52 [Xanthomonas phage Suba]CAA2409882.1 hypothetical protein [Xanthomonas phage Suba]
MKISELMERLGELQGEHGDLVVVAFGGNEEVGEVTEATPVANNEGEAPTQVLLL